jgi:hypothetical protein
MERNKHIQYIYENIDKINNHQNYIKLLAFHGCSYTTNSNGIFVNLNKLEDNVINDFYIRIHNELTNECIVEDSYEKKIQDIKKYVNVHKRLVNKKEDIITIDSFNKQDMEIIKYSKKYNL